MSWMRAGYESTDDPYKDVPQDSSRGPKRWFVYQGTTKRCLFLDDDPSTYWEHNFKWNGTFKGNFEPCVHKNKLPGWQQDGCPLCVAYKDKYPYFIGLHTVVNLTPWTNDKGMVFNLQRRIFAAKLGSDEKPGVLRKLKKLLEKHGHLRGLVFDIERPGKKTAACGSEFDLVENLSDDQIEPYLREQIKEYLAEKNPKLDHDKRLDEDELLKEMVPFNFEKLIEPRPLTDLRQMFSPSSSGGSSSSGGGDGDGGGGGYGGDDGDPGPGDGDDPGSSGGDDDIPY